MRCATSCCATFVQHFIRLKEWIMNQTQEARYLKEWGFKDRAKYEQYVKERLEDLEFIAPQLFKIFRDTVRTWEADYSKNNKGKRFVAETISPPRNKLIKGSCRVVEKILDSWNRYAEWEGKSKRKRAEKQAPARYDPSNFLYIMTDLIRFRIVCNYLSDVRYIEKRIGHDIREIEERIRAFDKKCKKIKVKKNDYVEIPFPERRAGHRAIQYVFQYSGDGGPVLFEVQVMTQLQHAWDKKDHHLIYEYVRVKRGNEIPLYLRNRIAAMSELLYVADTVFDALREDITKCMKKDNK